MWGLRLSKIYLLLCLLKGISTKALVQWFWFFFPTVSSVIKTYNFKTHKIWMRGASGWWLMMHLAKEHYELVTAASLPKQCWPQPSTCCLQGRSLHTLIRNPLGSIANGLSGVAVMGPCARTGLCGEELQWSFSVLGCILPRQDVVFPVVVVIRMLFN